MKNVVSKKKWTIVAWSAYGVLLIATLLAFIFAPEIYGVKAGVDIYGNILWNPRSVFNQQVSDNMVIQYLFQNGIPNLIKTVQIIGVSVTLGLLLHLAAKITFHTKKGITIAKLIVNFIKWVIAITAAFLIMAAWGADTTMMLASAGVLTLIIGLGSQALVADILAGIFIVFEGDFQVGDIVIIDGWRGEVQSIGIRTTHLVDVGGNIKIINNSEIKTLINQTQELSVAKAYISISYGTRIEKVEAIIADHLEEFPKKIPAIVEGTFYKGVSELGESSVVLLFVAKCKESDIYQVQRDLNRELKILFDDNGIEIPFNQLVVHMDDDEKKERISQKEEKKAKQFAEEQKELSKDLEIKQ